MVPTMLGRAPDWLDWRVWMLLDDISSKAVMASWEYKISRLVPPVSSNIITAQSININTTLTHLKQSIVRH